MKRKGHKIELEKARLTMEGDRRQHSPHGCYSEVFSSPQEPENVLWEAELLHVYNYNFNTSA